MNLSRITFRTMLSVALSAAVSISALAAEPKQNEPNKSKDEPAAIADRPNQVRGDEITPAQQAAVDKGLAYLASIQRPDGSFGDSGGYGAQAGIGALSGIAFMGSGNLPDRGKYGATVQKALNYVLSCSQQNGLITGGQSGGEMYSHGFATLFLAEIYGMTGDEQVKERLSKAVGLIEASQNKEGGWRYRPAPLDADISVTICQVMALRAARDAGIKVEKDTIDQAITYVKGCQNPDGGFSYQSNRGSGGGGSGFARSAAGVATLYYAGVFEGQDLERGLKYIINFKPGKAPPENGNYYYGQYYAVQAMFLAGGDYWAQWYPAIRDQLIAKQNADGRWTGDVNDAYATAVALIILQMPNRYLPVFNGKGPGS